MAKIKILTDDNFTSETSAGITLVDFYADWCGPCKMLAPVLASLSEKLEGKASVAKLDIDTNQTVTSQFEVTSIPTVILLKDGKEVDRVVGLQDEESLEKLVCEAAK